MLSTNQLQLPQWAIESNRQLGLAATLVLLCSIAYCYLLARLEGADASLTLSILWASSDWALWLLLIPILVQQISNHQGLSLTDKTQLVLVLQATAWMPLAAVLLRCSVELLMTQTPYAQVLSLAYKRAPLYLIVWLLLLAYVFWHKHAAEKTKASSLPDTEPDRPAQVRTFVVQSSHAEHVVRLDEVQYFKACGNYLEVKVQDNLYLMRATMKAVEKAVAGSVLVRCHRSFFVNLNYVQSMEYAPTGNHDIVLHSGEKIPVSKSFREQFRAQYYQSGGMARTH
ncbi:LytTR family DNA-binding domain-containing protein [Rheinheimera mesophila]|nr:LytTR family DNA-binding domain-containing protein [Rheinheimera mesophila]